MIRRLLAWLFGAPASPLLRLEARAAKLGTLTLQQVEGPEALYWTVSLRANRGPSGLGPRYAWTARGDNIAEAIANVIAEAGEYKIGARPVLPNAPKLGGREFDEPHVRLAPLPRSEAPRVTPPAWGGEEED